MTQAPEAFKAHPQFILWRLDNGQKRPLDPATLRTHDPHDPAIWLSYQQAAALAAQHQAGLGFVFTDNDPFFFLDIDNCLVDGQWSQQAQAICSQLAGCAMEVSLSGRGLHIFGSADLPPHGCKNISQHLELYHTKRFVALTGHHLQGDAGHRPHNGTMAGIVSQYFPPTSSSGPADTQEWTTGPCAEWAGPIDDQQLIDRMLGSRQSAGAMFGSRASIRDLWDGNDDALAAVYPPQSDAYPYDHSSADAALCAHLAFWTGKDCERMDRLFRMSALVRDKWTDREDYRHNTVIRACAGCRNVLGGNRPAQEQQPDSPVKVGVQFMTIDQQIEYFRGCVYVRDSHHIYTPDGALLKPEQFKAWYGGYLFAMDSMNQKTTTDAWKAFTENQGVTHPKVIGTVFRPEDPRPIVQEAGGAYANTYVKIETPRTKGDPSRFINHLRKLIPDQRDREILLAYLAACVQYIGVKFQWCVLIQGCEGNGKTLIFECLAEALDWRYAHVPNAQHIANQFNFWIMGKLIIGVEEIRISDKLEASETLKPLITNRKIEIHGKGLNQKTGDNRANFIMFSNYKDAVRKTKNDRRYCVFYSAQQSRADIRAAGMGGQYFPELYRWLREGGFAIVSEYLHNYAIPDEFNPATTCHRAPNTTSTTEVLTLSLGGVEQEILEAIDEGRYGFKGGWLSSLQLNRVLEGVKRRGAIPPNRRRQIVNDMGFIPHPGLAGGRVNNTIAQEGGKPVLYIRPDHPSVGLQDQVAIVNNYLVDQGVL